MLPFYTPWKLPKTKGFLVFWGTIGQTWVNWFQTDVQKQPSEVFHKKSCSSEICNSHRETPVLESLLNKVRPATSLKRDSNTSFFLWILWNSWEHLIWKTSANGCFLNVSFLYPLNTSKNLWQIEPLKFLTFSGSLEMKFWPEIG